jgi:bacterioferritin-associated ferredoxin
MDPDDHVCLCYRVSLRKLVTYMNREKPEVASQLCDCLNAGTGCQWCVPFLNKIHKQWQDGQTPDLPVSPEQYAQRRREYKRTGQRDADAEQGQ